MNKRKRWIEISYAILVCGCIAIFIVPPGYVIIAGTSAICFFVIGILQSMKHIDMSKRDE